MAKQIETIVLNVRQGLNRPIQTRLQTNDNWSGGNESMHLSRAFYRLYHV